MNILPRTDLAPYAAAPLNHLAHSLRDHLAGIDGDLHLSWNTLRPDLPLSAQRHHLTGAPTICMETPLIGRHRWQFDGSADPERTYYRLARWDPSVIYGGFHRPVEPVGKPGRFNDMIDKLGMGRPLNWRKPQKGDHILFSLQVPGDTSLKGISILEAALWDLLDLRRHTKRKIIVTLHPDCHTETWANGRLMANAGHLRNLREAAALIPDVAIAPPGTASADYFPGCFACVTYTSGTGFEAIYHGIPLVALHRGSFSRRLAAHDFRDIENIYRGLPVPELLLGWMNSLAHIQYSWAEIERGDHLPTIDRLLNL
jgi:hypothetical protein